jgi:hypothetical protein
MGLGPGLRLHTHCSAVSERVCRVDRKDSTGTADGTNQQQLHGRIGFPVVAQPRACANSTLRPNVQLGFGFTKHTSTE